MNITVQYISTSRKSKHHKKHKSEAAKNRSDYLKMLFGVMKGELGDNLIRSYVAGDRETFSKHWHELSKKVVEKVPKDGKESE